MRVLRHVLPLTLAAVLAAAVTPSLAQPAGTAPAYEPVRGQAGKDVIWIPTPEGLVDKMLTAARVGPEDRVFDLGAGDGIIAITAAKRFGATSVGIEYNPQMADHARRKVREAGVADKVRIITGDIFKEDFSAASVVTLYLLPDLNMRLRPTILAMKPGTRVVSHAFTMGDWEADEVLAHDSARAYLWIVPARVEGDWMLSGLDGGPARISLRQNFQAIGGLMTRASATQPLVGARLRGTEINFQFTGPDRTSHSFSGRLDAGRITGIVTAAGGLQTPVELTRMPSASSSSAL